ncbi:Adenylate kinase 7 (AK 7) (ATP-AMP transphosphorylase 7), partial [Durusdinium trenchii]
EGINPLEATPYFLAVDQPPSAVLQKDLVQGIVDEMGEHYEVPRVPYAEAMKVEEPERLELREALALDLNLEPSALALAEDFCANCDPPGWVCKEGLSANLRSIADEFCAGKKLRCMRILVAGPPASGKSNLAKAVAEHFKVPYLTFPVPIESADVEKMATQITSNVCRYRGYVLDAGGIGFAEAEKLFRFDVEVPKSEGDEVDPVEEEGAEPAPPKIERRLNEETCPAYVIITQAPAALCKGKWQNAGGSSLETFEKTMQAYIDNNLTSDIHSLQDFFQDVASKGVLNLPIAGKDPDDLFESARIYIESSGRPFNYLPTEDEVSQEIRQQRLEQLERLAAELAAAQVPQDNTEAERKEQRLHELRLQRVAEHEAAQKKLAQMPLREYLMKYMVPNLTEGLIEVCKVLPDNPVDYLANYLEEHAATTPGDTR